MHSHSARWLTILAVPVVLLLPARAPGQEPAPPPNFLVDISQEFVNAAVAQSIDRTDAVQDVILKTRITGTGRTLATVGASLVPSDGVAVIDLVTTGTTTAATVGVNGPVQLYSDSTVPFQIRQRVYIRPEGVEADDPRSHAEGDSTLTGITTNFHCLLDRLVKRIACKQYRKNKDEGEYIAARHAEDQLNDATRAEAAPRLRDADQALKKNLAELREKGIAYTAVSFSTSADVLFVRANVGGAAPQVAPPPAGQAYLALRVHQSALNESARVKLSGKTYTGEQLEKEAKKLGWADAPMAKDDKDFSITFAKDKPLEVHFADHGFSTVLRLAEFTSGDNEYTGMDMTVKYKFVAEGDKIKAVRQGPIEAFPPGFKPGQKLSGRATTMRAVLQRRFGKFFKEELVLKDIELSKDLRQAGPLTATRAASDRGWLLLTWRKAS